MKIRCYLTIEKPYGRSCFGNLLGPRTGLEKKPVARKIPSEAARAEAPGMANRSRQPASRVKGRLFWSQASLLFGPEAPGKRATLSRAARQVTARVRTKTRVRVQANLKYCYGDIGGSSLP